MCWIYDRQWSLALLAHVLESLREEYVAAGNERLFDRLRDFLAADESIGTHADAAVDLGMTAGAVKVAVHRIRRRYREALRQRVADTVNSSEDIEDEIRHLLQSLSRPQDIV